MSETNALTEGTEAMSFMESKAAKKKHDEIASWTRNQFQSMKNARLQIERQWYVNLAFYFGKQNVHVMRPQTGGLTFGGSTKLWVPPAPYYRARPVINRIRPTIRHELSQLTNTKPNASIVPASAEDRDLYAAMAGEQIWENEYNEKKVRLVIRRAVWWTLTCGSGFIKTWWDGSAGPQTQVMTEKGPGMMPMGDVCFAPETPFNIFVPDLREEEIENQPYMIHAQAKSPEWVQMHFPEALDGDKINPGSADATDLMDESFLNLVGTRSLERQRSCLVLEVWIKPQMHPQFPQGAFFTMIGDKIVQGQQGMPYSHGKYPFAKIDHIPGGKFYGTSSIEDLVPLQKEYNRTRGQIIEAKNRMAKPQLIAPRGSVDVSKITTEPGQVIQYTPGFDPPKPLPLTPLPNYVLEELDRIKMDWDDISGQHDVSKGQVPPGVTAATAISYLQERDESTMSPTFDSLEEAIEKTARLTLNYVHDYWMVERMVKVTGADGSFDVMAFKGSELGSNTDIKVESGSSLPTSKAARQAFVMDLMKLGFITPEKGLEVMEIGGIDKIYEQIQVDQHQAQRENLKMSKVTPELLQKHIMAWQQGQQATQMGADQPALVQSQGMPTAETPPAAAPGMPPGLPEQDPGMPGTPGMPGMGDSEGGDLQQAAMGPDGLPMVEQQQEVPQPPPIVAVNTWDNHQVHIMYHNQFRKGQAFEQLPDFVKQIFEQHVQMHIAAIGSEMITQNPMMAAGLPPELGMMLQGGNPEGGPSPADQGVAKGSPAGGGQDQGGPPRPEQNPLNNGQPGPNAMPPMMGG